MRTRARMTMVLALLAQVGMILFGYFHGPGRVPLLGICLGATVVKVLVGVALVLMPATLIYLKALLWGMDSEGRLRQDTLLYKVSNDFGLVNNGKVRFCPSYWALGLMSASLIALISVVVPLLYCALTVITSPEFIGKIGHGLAVSAGWVWTVLKYAVPVSLYIVGSAVTIFTVIDLAATPSGRYAKFCWLVVDSAAFPLAILLWGFPAISFLVGIAPDGHGNCYPGGFWGVIHDKWQVTLALAVCWSVGCYVLYVLWLALTMATAWGWSALTQGPVAKVATAAWNWTCMEIPVAPLPGNTSNPTEK